MIDPTTPTPSVRLPDVIEGRLDEQEARRILVDFADLWRRSRSLPSPWVQRWRIAVAAHAERTGVAGVVLQADVMAEAERRDS